MSNTIERLDQKIGDPASGESVADVQDVLRALDITDRLRPLVDATERIFGVAPTVSPGVPDLGEGPYLVFRVTIPDSIDAAVVSNNKSHWHDAVIELIPNAIAAARLMVDYR